MIATTIHVLSDMALASLWVIAAVGALTAGVVILDLILRRFKL